MKLTRIVPETWKELQDYVSKFLNESGYKTTSPFTIPTVRGTVEVDVFVESPDIFANIIICECKYWNTPIPKEKIHAFRTVVYDSGATLGIIITKTGFQSGAIEAAKYSNVLLFTWDEFLNIIKEKWVKNQLKLLKVCSDPLSVYLDVLSIPLRKFSKEGENKYFSLVESYSELRLTCHMIKTIDILNHNIEFYRYDEFNFMDEYIKFLIDESKRVINEFKCLFESEKIELSPSKFIVPEEYLFMYL